MRRTVSAVVLLACLPVTACAATTASRATPAVTVTRTVPSSASPSPTPATASPTPSSLAPATTAAAVRTAAPAPPPARPQLSNASAVVSQYYQDITDHDYRAAWALGGSNIAGTTYGRWVSGFATTESITLGTVSGFGASRVHAVLYATQTDGTVKTYEGTYTVADGVLVGASIRQSY
ncbi:hypothetical protein [Streptomyces sp. TP-A0356]|uniref:hypothetical protein n=1 Tax=Streptomyces sp. TP-A0356 TaxID=1359208 RepID=UPI0006E3B0BB|nr:hypothetical protein [Streptomyces sp. TP-A0356]